MDYREFGKAGFKVSLIGMGTYYDWPWFILAGLTGIRRHAKRIVAALRTGLDAGMNLIDTAELYQSEPLIGEAIRGRRRDELFVASKVWPNHLHYDAVIRACERSLKRLGTPYLDLYQIHYPNRRIPISETMRALERLVDEGKILQIGVSNFSLKRMVEAEEALSRHELVSTQMHYNLAHREVEADILPHCEKEKIALLAYYPLAHGKLVGGRDRRHEVFLRLGEKHGGKTHAQIALNWLWARSPSVFPIPRASNPPHVEENAGAVGWRLDEADLRLLDAVFPPRNSNPRRGALPPLPAELVD